MRHVQKAFDNGVEELVDSYNTSKDSNKYSVLYRQGRFRDDTLGVDDYDYRVQGLVYMKEKEGRNYGNKWGYYAGFGVSRFDFDDAPTYHNKSKEDVYSVRAGLHFVKNLSGDESLRWKTKVEGGYNRHEAERTLELDRVWKNKGNYDSWQVRLDNRLEKTILRTFSSQIDLYAGVNLEYGDIGEFKEKGDGVELQIKGSDYFSVRPEVGIAGYKRVYVGRKLSLKLEGQVSYGHELGDFYKENQGRVRDGKRGYYDLIRPEEEKGTLDGRVGITFEKANRMGITFDVGVKKQANKSEADVTYGAKIKYVF